MFIPDNQSTPVDSYDKFYYPPQADLDLSAKPWVLSPPKALKFIHANVVDTPSLKVLENYTLCTKDGVVTKLAPSTLEDGENDESQYKTIDVEGLFLCPGLIDCHVHITAIPGYSSISAMFHTSRDETVLRSAYVLKSMLARGYTTVRDVGGATKAHADATAQWLVPGPRVFQGGPLLSQSGGHGDIGDPFASICCASKSSTPGLSLILDGVPEALRTSRNIMKQGADHIKICTSGGVGSVTDVLEGTQFTQEELKAITGTVKNMSAGKSLVTTHCYTSEGIRHAIEGGVGCIEHGNLLDRPTARLMAEKGIFLTPTLAVHQVLASPPFNKFILPSQLEKNEIVRQKGLEAIQIAEEEGVTVCLGSDMLGPQHPFQTNEFPVRAKVLSSPTVLKQATINGAKLVGLEAKAGQLTVGAFADILILKKNPLLDVTILDRPKENLLGVIKEGRCVKSSVDGLIVEIPLV
ncbi:hypothetical protein BT69DRAFT_1309158 [Atractiella rhizophila]|nr:hypothetical protein BT69DRAFT_1309158 [Atractiella rhizophila]